MLHNPCGRQVKHADIGCALHLALHLETAVDQDVHHVPVLGQHIDFKKIDALVTGNMGKLIQHVCTDAQALVFILDFKSYLGAVGAGLPGVTAYGNDALVRPFSQRSHQCKCIVIVDCTITAGFFPGHHVQYVVEAQINRLFAQPAEERQQTLFVFKLYRAQVKA